MTPTGSPVELRVLTGPNLYFPRPAVKLTLDASAAMAADSEVMLGWQRALGVRGHAVGLPGTPARLEVAAELAAAVVRKVASKTRRRLAAVSRPGDDETVIAAFPFRHQDIAEAFGNAVAQVFSDVTGGRMEPAAALSAAADQIRGLNPGPVLAVLRPKVPIVAVTGTNGKTTTTRLISHLIKADGRVPGWSSTDGIVINGVTVETGDWSGPGGAARVLSDPTVQVAVTETARGGILLRGIGVPYNDVSVITNISADHLGTLGVHTIEQLAEVKSVVARITKPSGWTVLNADDELVAAMRLVSRARPWFYSLDCENPYLAEALEAGGRGITVVDGTIVVLEHGLDPRTVLPVNEVPLTLGGSSKVNVSNVLAAIAAALGIGCDMENIRAGLATFAGDVAHNSGRLNTYLLGETALILDLAHNEASVASLLAVGHAFTRTGGELVALVSTPGDRSDDAVHAMGKIAADAADRVLIAEKSKYLRGREVGELPALWRAGAAEGGLTELPVYDDELLALQAVLDGQSPGGVLPPGSTVAVCALEQRGEMADEILRRGGHEMTPAEITDRLRV
ncbi:Mur ligase [Nakamurella antarctica]|uniref:Mur ligase n=1 Tax=Nakamurella antarctica TaxID=1902245 RepID=A0A3G8ZRV9_9ACTN|nr:Mur ligase family protein [Nakamurella antarctica]AZI57244.1 Mur ligase [Nakamurella antarctica]